MKVALCTPSLTGPTKPYMEALKASIEPLRAAGFDVFTEQEFGCPYISEARAKMLRKALDKKAEIIVFIDYDISWSPEDLLKLIRTDGDVIAGLYRFKEDEEHYMGILIDGPNHQPVVKGTPENPLIKAECVPAGFLKITPHAVNRFMEAFPELVYGPRYCPYVDLFNHGAHKGVWWGEDYAFSRRWREAGGEIWIRPDLTLSHHSAEKVFKGNFHEFMMRQPGGSMEGK